MSDLTKSSAILIIGAGAWGTSTALALARAGYTSVTVVDPCPVPSPLSAATDVNKIVDGAVDGPNATALGKALALSVQKWRNDPIYSPFHHSTGIVLAGSTPKVIEMLHEDDLPYVPDAVKYDSPEDFRKALGPAYTGNFPGWKGFMDNNMGAGWVSSVDAVCAAAREAGRLGVAFRKAKVTRLSFDEAKKDVNGAVTDQEEVIRADRTILCAGAYTSQIFDLHDETHATAWVIAHIELSGAEVKDLKGTPVLWSNNMGFIMPPEEGNELKICDQHAGYVNRATINGMHAHVMTKLKTGRLQSVPFARDDMPLAAEQRVRQLLKETLPDLANRPFSHARICWCADTADGTFLIDRHAKYSSLVIAAGGSGLGVMHMPMIGEWIVQTLEGTLDPELAHLWRMRPELAEGRDWKDCPHAWADPGDRREEFTAEEEWTSVGVPYRPMMT